MAGKTWGLLGAMRHFRRPGIIGLLAVATLLAATPAVAAPANTPTIVNLGTLPGDVSSYAVAVNNFGIVIGSSTDAAGNSRAVKWNAAGVITALSTLPGGTYSQAYAINDFGTIVGDADTSTGDEHAVQWNPAGVITDLGALPDQRILDSEAFGINDLGVVVGDDNFAPRFTDATEWNASGTISDIGAALAIGDTSGTAINDFGVVAGSQINIHAANHAIRINPDGTSLALPDLPGAAGGGVVGNGSEANGINNADTIVGDSPTSTIRVHHAVRWNRQGAVTDLGTLPGGIASSASSINDLGLIAGESDDGTVGHAVLWSPDGRISTLPDLPGGSNGEAAAISDTGIVVGSDDDTQGNSVAVRWRV